MLPGCPGRTEAEPGTVRNARFSACRIFPLHFFLLCATIIRLIYEEVCSYGYCRFRRADYRGQSNSYFSKSKAKTFEAKLALGTKIAASVFIVLSLVMLLIK